MLARENFTINHINKVKDNRKVDPAILERSIFALGLLEALVKVKMPFIFKGGTSMMLLLDNPKRLSTDIDIIVAPETDISDYLNEVAKIYPFKQVSEDERKVQGRIVKRHYKFSFYSELLDDDQEILLDVLYENNHYTKLIEKEIKTEILITEGEQLKVTLPSVDCIIGDKLTAFAPHTTGVPLGVGKEIEIMKQLYDIATLLDKYQNYDDLVQTFIQTATTEIYYRDLKIEPKDVLEDTLDTAICIAARGTENPIEYAMYKAGIKGLKTHIYDGTFSGEIAAQMACKVIYFAACLLKQMEPQNIKDETPYLKDNLGKTKFKNLSYLRKLRPQAFAYVALAAKILQE